VKSLLRQLRLSRRPATQAAAAAAAMLGGRRVRPLPSQEEEAIKAGKVLLLEEKSHSQSINHRRVVRQLRVINCTLTRKRDQRRRSSGRLLRGLYPSQRDSAVAGALQASGFTMRSRVDAWEIIYFEDSRLVGKLKE
jgi:hypothetical protein